MKNLLFFVAIVSIVAGIIYFANSHTADIDPLADVDFAAAVESPGDGLQESPVIARETGLQLDPMDNSQTVLIQVEVDGGTPASGAEIKMIALTDGKEVGRFISDKKGQARIPIHVHEAVLAIASWNPNGYDLSGNRIVTLDPELPVQVISISPEKCSVVGLVLRGETPVMGLTVKGVKTAEAITDELGYFEISNFIPGPIIVRVGSKDNTLFQLDSGIKMGESKFVLIELPTTAIQVTVQSGVGSKLLMENVAVAIEKIPAVLGSVRRFGITGKDGGVLFDAVKPGKYLVSTGHVFANNEARDSYPSEWAPSFEISLASVGVEKVVLQVNPAAELRLRVFDTASGHQESAFIFYRIPEVGIVQDMSFKLRVNADGYSVFKVSPGTIEVIAIHSEAGWGEVRLDLLPGQIAEEDIWLSTNSPSLTFHVSGPRAHLIDYFQVHDKEGGLIWSWARLLRGGSMTTFEADGTSSVVSSTDKPDEGEDFSKHLPALAPGFYVVTCYEDGEIVASGEIELTSDSDLRMHSSI